MRRKLTTFQRQRAIADYISAHTAAKVDELAERFTVSEGTIRNDLNTLEDGGSIMRVRGGAVLHDLAHLGPVSSVGNGATPGPVDRIAKWAAEQVRDGDVILLDASRAALAMVPHLRERRNLTVVTTRLEAARVLAADPSKTVILTGGIVRPDGSSLTGDLSQDSIRDLRIGTAFLSGMALSEDGGLMDSDPLEIKFKRQAVESAARVVALQEAASIDRVGLHAVAPLSRVDHVFTDAPAGEAALVRMRAAGVAVTICGPELVQSLAPPTVRERRYRVGFANLTEALLFPVDVRRSLERAAAERSDLDLTIADNAMEAHTAIRVAENLVDRGVDLVIEYQLDDTTNSRIMSLLQRHAVPVIAIDIPIIGATYFGVDHYRSGHLAGEGLGRWIGRHWSGEVDHLLVLEEPRAGALPGARIDGQVDGLFSVLGPLAVDRIVRLDSGNTTEVSREAVRRALAERPRGRVAVASFNDDAALGALEAVEAAGRRHEAAIAGLGADRRMRRELRRPGTPVVGSTSFHPESYGPQILDLAVRILNGEAVPPAVYVEHEFVTPSNVREMYPDDPA